LKLKNKLLTDQNIKKNKNLLITNPPQIRFEVKSNFNNSKKNYFLKTKKFQEELNCEVLAPELGLQLR